MHRTGHYVDSTNLVGLSRGTGSHRIGSAAITPVAIILVVELTSKRRRGLFIGLVNTGYTIGVSCGAIIAGALEPVVGWRAIFWLQVPLALAAGITAFYAIPKDLEAGAKKFQDMTTAQKLSRIDYFGVVTMISALVLFLYAFTLHEIAYTPIVLSGFMLLLFVFVESYHAADPNSTCCCTQIQRQPSHWSVNNWSDDRPVGSALLHPVYAIAVRDWSQATAGVMLLPTNGGFALGGVLVGWLHVRRAGSFYISSLIS